MIPQGGLFALEFGTKTERYKPCRTDLRIGGSVPVRPLDLQFFWPHWEEAGRSWTDCPIWPSIRQHSFAATDMNDGYNLQQFVTKRFGGDINQKHCMVIVEADEFGADRLAETLKRPAGTGLAVRYSVRERQTSIHEIAS